MTPRPQPATGSASGKVILFGEHAVVYGAPAIAVPINGLRATATFTPAADSLSELEIVADGIALNTRLSKLATGHPLAAAILETLRSLTIPNPPAGKLQVQSTIPAAAGLGSSAAVTIALARALAASLSRELTPHAAAHIAQSVETLQHGTASGIDPTVIAHNTALYFKKGSDPIFLQPSKSLMLIVADTGEPGSTRNAVAAVRARYDANPSHHQTIFAQIGALSDAARGWLANGAQAELGELMHENQRLLQLLGVSTTMLDNLCAAARQSGAFGAKLTGAGTGGCMIALVDRQTAGRVQAALLAAGAKTASINDLAPATL